MAAQPDSDIFSRVQQLAADNPATVVATTVAATAAAVGIATVSYIMATRTSGEPMKMPFDLDDQTVIIGGKPEHRASRLSRAPDYFERDKPAAEVNTVYGALERGLRESKNGPCLGERTGPNKEFQWSSYREVYDKVLQFGSGLVHKGVIPSNKTKVGIYASNRPEWVIADFGCQAYSICPVPLYDTLGMQAIKYILQQCDIVAVVCDSQARVKTLINIKPELPNLGLVVLTEPLTEELKSAAATAGVDLISFEDILNVGKENSHEPTPAKPDDIFSICYTSGTTGNPKGVVLTQFAFMSMVQSLMLAVQTNFMPTFEDVHLSYLPLAHNFERALHVMMLLIGGQIGYSSRDIKLLTNDLMALKPTVFVTVPRLLNRIYDAVHAEVKNSMIKSTLLRWALVSKQKDVDRFVYRKDTVWDKLLFSKVQNNLGGRVRFILTGSAPISVVVMRFLRCALGCLVFDPLVCNPLTAGPPTDPCAGSRVISFIHKGLGNVGVPFPGCHIKLVDVPEMNYYAKDNIGEVCAKADFIFREYYNEPEKTAEALDSDGWLHTGDVGTWLPNGTLKIVDRKKNIFKLAQGEYVATEKIENVYQNSQFVGQIFVDGDSLQTCLMAVVVPDPLFLQKWAKTNSFPTNLKDFCQHKDAKDVILKDMLAHGKKAGLLTFEQAKDIYLESELFTSENDLLTPTMKNKRPTLRNKYKEIIAGLYTQNGL